jgi:type II secretory pathway component PulL
VPAGADNKVLHALPYLVEEKIADEPEALFITRLAKVDAEKWDIVAINREWLAHIIKSCRDNELEPDVVVPDVLLLPYRDNHVTIAVNNINCWARYHKALGIELENASFPLLIESLVADESIPKDVVIVCEKKNDDMISTQLSEKGFQVKEIKEVINWPLFFCNAAKSTSYNLLQNEFAPKRKHTKETKLYKIAGILLAVWVALTFFGKIGQYFYFKLRYEATQTEIEKSYRTVFPDITRVVSPKATLQRELEKLNEAKKRGNFLFLMTDFGKVMTTFPNAQIENIDYKNSTLTLTLHVENFTVLKEIGQKLEQQGFLVKQENAVTQNNQVQATLILQKGGK